jgi:polyribonucleotide nucleotidyltransferase
MDLKNDGLKHEIVKSAFEMTREARYQILDNIMLPAISEPRPLAASAPKMIKMSINPDKIREVIGTGGKVIQKLTAETGCKIDIEDDGTIYIASKDIEACRTARKSIEDIVFEPEIGALYYGKVTNIRSDFGAWVELAPGKDGLIKIKDLEFKRTEKVEDVLNLGDMTWVKVMNVDDRGRIDLSRKDALKERGEA